MANSLKPSDMMKDLMVNDDFADFWGSQAMMMLMMMLMMMMTL